MNNQNQGLPVSPNQVDTTSWINQGLPYQPPFTPQINLGQMQQFLPILTGYLMLDLQNNANRSPLRTFIYNLYSRNRYQNEDFTILLGTATKFAQFLIATQNMQPEQAIMAATTETCSMLMAVQAQRHQALSQYINPQIGNELTSLLNQFEQIKHQILAFEQGGNNPNANRGWNQGNQGNQWGGNSGGGGGGGQNWNQPARAGWVPNSGGNTGGQVWNQGNQGNQGNQNWGGQRPMNPVAHTTGGWNQNPGQNQNPVWNGNRAVQSNRPIVDVFHSNPQGGNNTVQSRSTTTGMGMRPRGNATDSSASPQFEELTMENGKTPEFRSWSSTHHSDSSIGAISNSNDGFTAMGSAFDDNNGTHVPLKSGQEWPKVANLDRPYDSIVLEDGTELRPAASSGWKVTFNPDKPYHLLYDPSTHVLFHLRKPNGSVYEVLNKKTADMEYLDHELDAKLRDQHKDAEPNKPKIEADWALVQKLKPMPGMLTASAPPSDTEGEPRNDDVPDTAEPVVVAKVIQVHNVAEADMRANLLLPEAEAYRKARTPLEYYFDRVTPVAANTNLIKGMQTLADTTTLARFRELLLEQFNHNHLPEDVYHLMNQRATDRINEALLKNMGITGWKIGSFVGDYEDLLKELGNDFGKTVVEALQRHAKDVIVAATAVLSGEAYAQYLLTLGGVAINPEAASRLLVFRERCSTTRLPWSLSDVMATMNLDTGSMIPESELPNMFKAVKSIVERTSDQAIPFGRRFLMTEDNQLLEIHVGYFGGDCFLLSKFA